jgi:VanZ family protein
MESLRHKLIRYLATSVLLVYWAALAVGTHVPMSGHGTASYNDKLLHLGAYAGLAFLLCCAWAVRRPLGVRAAAAIWGICAVYAALDEMLQVCTAPSDCPPSGPCGTSLAVTSRAAA